jgi:hypothetical protein
MTLPDGWTDDMNVTIRSDRTLLDLARTVMERVADFNGGPEMVPAVAREFGMSEADAVLAFDRVQGGIIRALTGRRDNCPERDNDPLAWHSFHLVWKTLPRRHWWSGQKEPGGPWKVWYDELRERRKQQTSE